jgi:hypothetical protein
LSLRGDAFSLGVNPLEAYRLPHETPLVRKITTMLGSKTLRGCLPGLAACGALLYPVKGMAYVGTAGLAALAALPANTMVADFGSVQTSTQNFTATTVLAGTRFENPSKDMVSGTVIARSANTLTLLTSLWVNTLFGRRRPTLPRKRSRTSRVCRRRW